MDLDQVCPPTSQSGSRQECSCEEFWEKIQGNVCGFFFCWAKDTTRILVNSLWEDEDLEFEGGWSSEVSPPTEVPVRTTSPSCHWSEWKCFQNGCRQRQPFHHRTLRTNRLRKDPWPQTQKSLLWTKHFPFFFFFFTLRWRKPQSRSDQSPDQTLKHWQTRHQSLRRESGVQQRHHQTLPKQSKLDNSSCVWRGSKHWGLLLWTQNQGRKSRMSSVWKNAPSGSYKERTHTHTYKHTHKLQTEHCRKIPAAQNHKTLQLKLTDPETTDRGPHPAGS